MKRPVPRPNIGRVIAQRTVTIPGVKHKSVTLSVGIPRQTDSDRWKCPISIEGLEPAPIIDFVAGVDSLQALLIGVGCIRWHLMQSGEKFEWLGDSLIGANGGIPRFLRIGMGKEFDDGIEAAITRETDGTRKFRAKHMRRWLKVQDPPAPRASRQKSKPSAAGRK